MRALALALLAALPAAASAQVADRLADLRLATAVRLALVDAPETRALDVTVSARDGSVAVAGDVPAALAPRVAAVARSVPGVRRLAGDAPAPVAETLRGRPEADRPVPAAPPPAADPDPEDPPAGGPTVHTVVAGDTVFSLARRYGTTVRAILELNGLDAPDIRVGQRLRVR